MLEADDLISNIILCIIFVATATPNPSMNHQSCIFFFFLNKFFILSQAIAFVCASLMILCFLSKTRKDKVCSGV